MSKKTLESLTLRHLTNMSKEEHWEGVRGGLREKKKPRQAFYGTE
jgi:hypothetical protein